MCTRVSVYDCVCMCVYFGVLFLWLGEICVSKMNHQGMNRFLIPSSKFN